MKLTLYTDYGLRVLLYLSLKEEATISEISEAYRIARPHVVKIVHHLGKAGLVQTQRGRQGGVRLAQAPEEINLGQTIRLLEPNFHMVECFNREGDHCVITPVCKLKGVLGEALQAFFETLDRYTLADVVANRDVLMQELSLSS